MSTLTDFVSAEESVLVRWEGTLRDDGAGTDVVLGTTDSSLVYCSDAGEFGLYPRDHVSAVESETVTVVEYGFEDHRLALGGGAVLSVGGFLGGILVSSGLLALLLLLVATGGLWLVERGWRHRDEFDGFDRTESEVERVVVHTDAGVTRTFTFPAETRAGAELSRFVRTG